VNVERLEPTIRSFDRAEVQGLPTSQDPRFAEHVELPVLANDGNTTFLSAWVGSEPVGHLNLRWLGNKEPEVRAYVTQTPELSQISVWPPEMQSQGIGTRLINTAEAMIADRGYDQVGLGVELTNQRAQRLYERLGYRDWGHGVYRDRWVEVDEDGREIAHQDPCAYLLKPLASPML
jgi:GNAT superfamily N-acetyltransferase